MLSKKAKYALKALIALAQNQQKSMFVSQIATQNNIPRKFLETILVELKNHGLLYSHRGRAGGYVLMQNPEVITLGQVIRIIDGPLTNTLCTSQTDFLACQECTQPQTCVIRIAMQKVQDATSDILNGITISDAIHIESIIE